MVSATQARDTFERARAFYKGGKKAGNKTYDLTRPDVTDKQRLRDKQMQSNQAEMTAQGRSTAKYSGRTPFEIGAELYGKNETLGNCGEMAAVAIFLAINQVHVPADEVTMATLTNEETQSHFFGLFQTTGRKFGHTFALLGTGKKNQRWVVDPWAGVCCTLDEYATKLRAKLAHWGTQGKRILAGGAWVEPENAIVAGLLEKTAKWGEVKANEKGK